MPKDKKEIMKKLNLWYKNKGKKEKNLNLIDLDLEDMKNKLDKEEIKVPVKRAVMQSVIKRLAAEFTPRNFTDFISAAKGFDEIKKQQEKGLRKGEATNIKGYITKNHQGNMTFITNFLQYVNESAGLAFTMADAGNILNRIVNEKLLDKEAISKRLPNKQNFIKSIFGERYCNVF